MIEMSHCDDFKPTVMKLRSVIKPALFLLIIQLLLMFYTQMFYTRVACFVQDTNQLPFVCRNSFFGSVALVCFLLFFLRHRTSQLTYKCDSLFGQISKSDWVQFPPVNCKLRYCTFYSSLLRHWCHKIKLKNRLLLQSHSKSSWV